MKTCRDCLHVELKKYDLLSTTGYCKKRKRAILKRKRMAKKCKEYENNGDPYTGWSE